MRAAERILPSLDRVRTNGQEKWIARCPAHDDQTPSLSIKQEADRVLLYCWSGCSTKDVVDALGINLSDLFDETRQSGDKSYEIRGAEDSGARKDDDLRCVALEGFRLWRSEELRLCGLELRERDQLALTTHDWVNAGAMSPEEAFEFLGAAYSGYSELEHRFEILRTGSDAECLELSRVD